MPEKLILEVVTPNKEVVQEPVASVQLPGANGYLGILPGHTPLLTELAVGALTYQKDSATVYVAILGGMAEVLGGRVTVLADDAERADEIDAQKARAEFAEAEKKLLSGSNDPKIDWDALLLEVARARVRLEVAEHAGAAARAS